MLKMLVVSESKTGKQNAKSGQNFNKNKCVQNSTQSMEKVTLPKGIMKIILDVDNAGGLGLKTTIKKEKQGAKFT